MTLCWQVLAIFVAVLVPITMNCGKYMNRKNQCLLSCNIKGQGGLNSVTMRVHNRVLRCHLPTHFFLLILPSCPFLPGSPDPAHFLKEISVC